MCESVERARSAVCVGNCRRCTGRPDQQAAADGISRAETRREAPRHSEVEVPGGTAGREHPGHARGPVGGCRNCCTSRQRHYPVDRGVCGANPATAAPAVTQLCRLALRNVRLRTHHRHTMHALSTPETRAVRSGAVHCIAWRPCARRIHHCVSDACCSVWACCEGGCRSKEGDDEADVEAERDRPVASGEGSATQPSATQPSASGSLCSGSLCTEDAVSCCIRRTVINSRLFVAGHVAPHFTDVRASTVSCGRSR